MLDGPVVALIVLAVGGALAALYFVVEHRRHGRDAERTRVREVERLPLFGTDLLATRGEDGALHAASETDAPVVRAVRRTPPRPAPPAGAPYANGGPPAGYPGSANGNGQHGAPYAPPPGVPYQAPYPPAYPPGYAPDGPPPRPAPARPAAGPIGSDAGLLTGETLRFALPDEGTLRFLPGRLEVSAGPDTGREVRFIAPPGADGRGPNGEIEVTFGRTEGPAFRHVQLLARTVSRRHAVMSLLDDHWSLKNLSATNPVILNGRPLAADEVAPLLVDGDRIEMGEVVFTFHSR